MHIYVITLTFSSSAQKPGVSAHPSWTLLLENIVEDQVGGYGDGLAVKHVDDEYPLPETKRGH